MFICNMIITPCLTFTKFALCRCAGVIPTDLKKANEHLSLLKLFAQKEGRPNLGSLTEIRSILSNDDKTEACVLIKNEYYSLVILRP